MNVMDKKVKNKIKPRNKKVQDPKVDMKMNWLDREKD